jgi:hypothetical protein
MAALVLASGAAAQPVTGEITLTNGGGLHGNAVIGMGRFGTITTIIPLPAGNVGGVTVNHIGNEDLVVIDRKIVGLNNGNVRTLVGSLAQPSADIAVDEDSTWVTASGTAVLGVNSLAGKRVTIATGFKNLGCICWNGTDGSLLVVDRGDDKIYAIARSGAKKVVATVPGVRCVEWNSYTGNIFVAAENILYDMSQGGVLTTLETNKPGLKNTTGMFLRSDRTLLVVQGDTSPTGVYAYYGSNGRYNRAYHEDSSPAQGINPRGVTVEHFRELMPVKPNVPIGGTSGFRINFTLFPEKTFLAALSFGHAPGIPVGNFRLHLNPDPLFFASLVNPALFKNHGTLNKDGLGTATLMVPDIGALVGVRIFVGAVVIDPQRKGGIGEASNALGVTFTK